MTINELKAKLDEMLEAGVDGDKIVMVKVVEHKKNGDINAHYAYASKLNVSMDLTIG